MSNRASRLDWLLFLLLGCTWGSSYLFIKIGVDAGLAPLTLVMLRLLLGFSLLALVVAAAREPLPRDPRMYGHLFVTGILSMALPFSLISFAEQRVDSAFAATIAAAIPLVVVVIGAFALREERLTPLRLAGVAVGFAGVAILVGFDPGTVGGGSMTAQLALLASTVSYGAGGVYARRFVHGLRPMIPALLQVGFALVVQAVLAFAFEHPLDIAVRPEGLFAVTWLGLLGSGVAYLLFFRLLGRWGATRTALVAYVLPVVGIALGALVLAEPIGPNLLAGAGLVVVGIAIVNIRVGARLRFARRAAAAGR